MSTPTRNQLLLMEDEELLLHCRSDRFRGTGRGGQKRNVTDSAIRVTHLASGLSASSDKTRSQHLNRKEALRLLRLELAMHWRQPSPDVWPWNKAPGLNNSAYPSWMATILDVLENCGYRLAEAAAACGVSTSRLNKDLARDSALWQYINQQRQAHNLSPLKIR